MKALNTLRRFAIITIALFFSVTISAAEKFDPQAYKKELHKYITKKANFKDSEATCFFKLFDEMRAKERKLFEQARNIAKQKPNTDEEIKNVISKADEIEISIKKVQQTYHQKMLKHLPVKKVYKALKAAEFYDRTKFKDLVVEKLSNDKKK